MAQSPDGEEVTPTCVGIDPSLTSLGLAAAVGGVVVATDRVLSKGHRTDSLVQRFERQQQVVTETVIFVHDHDADLVVIEGPSYASKFGHPHDRSGLWWGIVGELLLSGRAVVEVPPTCRMKYATGKGQAHKDLVLAAAIRRYPMVDIISNDIADAVILAVMGSRQLGWPAEQSLPQTHLAAMTGVSW